MGNEKGKPKKRSTHDLELFLSYGLKALLVVMAIVTFWRGEYTWFIGTVFSLYLVSLPAVLKRDYAISLPIIFDLAITASISLHVIGGYVDFYSYIGGYDHVTHFISSATISLIAVTALYILNFHTKLIFLPPIGFGIVTIFFAMSMGVVWEFLEWGTDIFFGTSLQHGLTDTMVDLTFDTIAGLIVGSIATARLKMGEFFEYGTFLEVGDIQNSIGYKRWQDMSLKDKKFTKSLSTSFRDPDILSNIIDRLVVESKHISDSQMEIWELIKNDHDDDGIPDEKDPDIAESLADAEHESDHTSD